MAVKARSRLGISAVLLLVIALGLSTRSPAIAWPVFVTEHLGDALWTVAVYLALAIVWPQRPPWFLAAAAVALSFCVEFSQLIRAPWLNELRATLPGQLLLGADFVWVDLLRYASGAAVALAVDSWLSHRHASQNS